MTPEARVAAAIEILDVIGAGAPAEQALTRWARRKRFAGSKDRRAIRDHIFDVLRQRDSVACLGGGTSGRALMAGLLRLEGTDPDTVFTGQGYAPAPLSDGERAAFSTAPNCESAWNLPDWLIAEMKRSLPDAARTAQALTRRAPVTLRVNLSRTSRAAARAALADEGIRTEDNPVCETALTVTEGATRLRLSECYASGLVELQDAASQAIVSLAPRATKCLDYCAGGGGKALALAAESARSVFAHDADPRRMTDLAPRAERAGNPITQLETRDLGDNAPFDLVLCDAPCSGSGSWRRAPDAKWTLTPARLQELCAVQDDILSDAARLVPPGGWLVYATCSVLRAENEDRVARFLRDMPAWRCSFEQRFDVSDNADGFYTAHLTHAQAAR